MTDLKFSADISRADLFIGFIGNINSIKTIAVLESNYFYK